MSSHSQALSQTCLKLRRKHSLDQRPNFGRQQWTKKWEHWERWKLGRRFYYLKDERPSDADGSLPRNVTNMEILSSTRLDSSHRDFPRNLEQTTGTTAHSHQ